MPYDHAPEYGKQYGYAVLTATFFAIAASKIRQINLLTKINSLLAGFCF